MIEKVLGFEVRTDLAYDLDNHFWVAGAAGEAVRIGMDPLGLETSGTLAQLAIDPVGTVVERGRPFGTLEAEKFVGSLVAPLSGEITAINSAAMEDPGIVQRTPYDAGWLIELSTSHPDVELPSLVTGREAIIEAFERKIRHYRLEGVLAE